MQSDLFKQFYSETKSIQKYKQLRKSTKDFFQYFFNINVDANDANEFPTFEETLGIIDTAIYRKEPFRGYTGKLNVIRGELIFLLANILDIKLQKVGSHHKYLVDRLKRNGSLLNTAFISTNYDILIDNALDNLYPEYHVDYGIDFTNYDDQQDWQRPDPSKSILLYKIHGSLNWLYCPVCVSLTLTPKQKEVATLAFKYIPCKNCATRMIPIIVPPTYFKDMSNYYLINIWKKIDTVLKDVKNIYFCGYSFPDADMHIKYLLKRMEIYRRKDGIRNVKIYIVNEHDGKLESTRDDEKDRYYRFFKEKNNVHYTNLSFENFAVRGI